ncbi:MAG: DUF6776 family protein [Panacagrimonas sp.]
MQHRIVVRRRGPAAWLRRIAVVLGLCLLSAGSYAAYRYWDPDAVAAVFADPESELDHLRQERRRLSRELRDARSELAALRGRSTFQARSCDIDAQACEAVRSSVTGLESTVAELREELAFYRNVAAPEHEVRAGVRVMRVEMHPSADPQMWTYEMVLVQPTRRDRLVKGTYEMQVGGLQGQKMKTLGASELQAPPQAERSFSFRSFQELTGQLHLPAGFSPSRLAVTLRVQDGRKQDAEVEDSFEWSRLVVAAKEP